MKIFNLHFRPLSVYNYAKRSKLNFGIEQTNLQGDIKIDVFVVSSLFKKGVRLTVDRLGADQKTREWGWRLCGKMPRPK